MKTVLFLFTLLSRLNKRLFVITTLTILCSYKSIAQQPRLVLPVGHVDGVHSATYSPDGKYIVSSSLNGSIKKWDATTGYLLLDSLNHKASIESVSYSPNSKLVLVRYKDKYPVLVEDNTGKVLLTLQTSTKNISQFSFSGDSKKAIIVSKNNSLEVLDLTTSKYDKILNEKIENIPTYFGAFSKSGSLLLTISNDNTIRIWQTNSGKLVKEFKTSLKGRFTAKFMDNDRKIFTNSSSYNSTCYIWNIENNNKIPPLYKTLPDVYYTEVSPDSKLLITVFEKGTAKIWTADKLQQIATLSQFSDYIRELNFSNDSKKLSVFTMDNTIEVWDIEKKRKLIQLDETNYIAPAFNPNSEEVLISKNIIGGTSSVYSLKTGKRMFDLNGKTKRISSITSSADGQKMLVAHFDTVATLWDVFKASPTGKLKGHESRSPIVYATFGPDEKEIITGSTDKSCKIWDAGTGNIIQKIDNLDYWMSFSQISADKQKILTETSGNNQTITKIWDLKSKKLLNTTVRGLYTDGRIVFGKTGKTETVPSNNLEEVLAMSKGKLHEYITQSTDVIRTAVINPDKTTLILISRFISPQVTVWDLKSGKLIKKILLGDDYKYEAVCFKKNFLIAQREGNISFFDLTTGAKIYELFIFNNGDYISKLPSGYYSASRNAPRQLHYVNKDLNIITFEQLDVKYNRPDKVLQAIGNRDTTLINSYKRAYEKRIQKLGIDTTSFNEDYNVPEADFADRNNVEAMRKGENLKLHIKATDRKSKLVQFNVWINDVPIYGMKGIGLGNRNKQSLDTTVLVQLSVGANRIETSVRNTNGLESYRMPLNVNYSPEVKPKEKVHFIGIGIDQFEDQGRNLMYSARDIRVLAAKMKKKYGESIVTDTLINKKVTPENVKALKKKLLATTVNDKVIVAFSGHGLLSSSKDYYLSTYQVNFARPEEGGLPYDELENILDSIPARKKLLLLDACHSGEVDKATDAGDPKSGNDTDKTSPGNNKKSGRRGVRPLPNGNATRLGLSGSFELMQSLFMDVGKHTGATVFAASSGIQSAYENSKLQHGIFSYYLIEAIAKYPTLTISELQKFVTENVEKESLKTQVPTSRKENLAFDWTIW